MPFAYIDSQGKEVSIPSADALRLRIELGAIVDSTEFHDTNTGQRGPAWEHEIYQALKRELESQDVDAFTVPTSAPMDPMGNVPAGDQLPVTDLPTDDHRVADPSVDAEEGDSPEADPFGEDPFDMGLEGLTLSDDPGPVARERDDLTRQEPWADDDFAEMPAFEVSEDPEPAPDPEQDAFVMDEGAFGGGPTPPPSEEAPARWDVSAEVEGVVPVGGDTEFGEPEQGSDPADAAVEVDYGEWSDPTAEGSVERPVDPYDRSGRSSPRPNPPQRKLTPKNSAGGVGRTIGFALAAVVLAGAGWFAVQTFGGSDDGGSSADVGGVALPALPTELQPQLRQLAQRASVRMVERFDSLPERVALPVGPGDQWLAGDYLANASRYDATAIYWRRMSAMVTAMRASEATLFEEAFRDEVESANLTQENADLLLTRGLAGFAAAAPDRAIIYDQLAGVVRAATDLHVFLVQNETDIDFEPADAGTSRDPLLEAVPVTRSLGDEMMGQVIEITDALDALGFLEVVATEPLLSVVSEKLVATGIR